MQESYPLLFLVVPSSTFILKISEKVLTNEWSVLFHFPGHISKIFLINLSNLCLSIVCQQRRIGNVDARERGLGSG